VWVSKAFEVDSAVRRHLDVSTSTSLLRGSGQVHVALINQDNGRVYLPIDTASSNSRSGRVYNADAGSYVARVEVARPLPSTASDPVTVRVVLDPPASFPCFSFFFPFFIPIVIAMLRASFESRRWSESDHAG
jgi:hypothetical protein